MSRRHRRTVRRAPLRIFGWMGVKEQTSAAPFWRLWSWVEGNSRCLRWTWCPGTLDYPGSSDQYGFRQEDQVGCHGSVSRVVREC